MPYEVVFSQAPNIGTQKKFAELSEDVTDGQEKEIEMSVDDFCGSGTALQGEILTNVLSIEATSLITTNEVVEVVEKNDVMLKADKIRNAVNANQEKSDESMS